MQHSIPRRLLIKYGFNWSSGFRGEDVWKCWHTYIWGLFESLSQPAFYGILTLSTKINTFTYRIPSLCILISSLSGATRKRVGMARLARAIPRFLVKPDKLDIKRHLHGILFIMQYFPTFKPVWMYVRSMELTAVLFELFDVASCSFARYGDVI